MIVTPPGAADGPLGEQPVARPRVSVQRPHPRFALLDLAWPGYRELFCVLTGAESVTIMAFDPSDASFDGPRLHHVPKPYGWRADADDEEMLLQVWQVLGHQR